MIFVVEDGTGITLANTFVSVEDADAYCDEMGLSAWGAAAEGVTAEAVLLKKQRALINASRWLSYYFSWVGVKASESQGLAFPRIISSSVGATVFPREVRFASILAAVRVYKGVVLSPDMKDGGLVKRVKVGPVDKEMFENGYKGPVYNEINDILSRYIKGAPGAQSAQLSVGAAWYE